MGAELVKALVHNRQAAFTHGSRKQRVCPLAIHEDLMVAVGEVKNKVLSKFQSRVHSHLRCYMVPPDPPICLLNFNKEVLVERQMIDESGGKKIKNPPEGIDRCAAFLIHCRK
jgi:hypothetical protein